MDPAGEHPEDHRKQHHKGHKAQHHQGQRIVEHQHGRQYAHHHHGILGQGDDDVGEHVADGIGIVGNTGHQLAHRNVVELLVAQLFNVGEHIQPDLRKDLLSGLLQDHGLRIGANQRNRQNTGVDGHHGPKIAQLEISLDGILNMADQQRRDDLVANGQHHHEKHQDKALPVRLGIPQESGDDLAVTHVPVGVIVLFLDSLQGNVGSDEHQREAADDGAHDHQRQVGSYKLKHRPRLLPPPASAGLPSCGIPHSRHTALRGCPQPPTHHRR